MFWPAWLRPLTWLCRLWLMAYPATSSAAVLTRRPEDRRCIVSDSMFSVLFRFLLAFIASRLVLIVRDMCSPFGVPSRLHVNSWPYRQHSCKLEPDFVALDGFAKAGGRVRSTRRGLRSAATAAGSAPDGSCGAGALT